MLTFFCMDSRIFSKSFDTDILTFECKKGHVWEAIFRGVINGSWCKQCYIEKISQTRKL